jgi:leucyl/phenylalanyl-tRNA--protein transferase
MFSRIDDASKVSFAKLCQLMRVWNFDFIDCQLANANVLRYGAQLVPRRDFLILLSKSLTRTTRPGPWTEVVHSLANT